MGIVTSVAGMIGLALALIAQAPQASSRAMAPLEQYLMADRQEEIALARSAAPASISGNADVLVLSRHGFELVAKGTNGFACLVQRGWSAPLGDPDFWNPHLRSPICFNPPAARSYMPQTLKRTDLILAGKSEEEMFANLGSAADRGELPKLEHGAMGYMMSKDQFLSEAGGHYLPHLMIFTQLIDPAAWGAGLAGAPLVGVTEQQCHISVFIVPVGHWSDGTAVSEHRH